MNGPVFVLPLSVPLHTSDAALRHIPVAWWTVSAASVGGAECPVCGSHVTRIFTHPPPRRVRGFGRAVPDSVCDCSFTVRLPSDLLEGCLPGAVGDGCSLGRPRGSVLPERRHGRRVLTRPGGSGVAHGSLSWPAASPTLIGRLKTGPEHRPYGPRVISPASCCLSGPKCYGLITRAA